MIARERNAGGAALALAVLRATLVVVIFVSEQLVDVRQLAGGGFFVVLSIAALYALVGIAVAIRPSDRRGAEVLIRLQPSLDVLFLVGLAFTSGAAYSDVRKAFFVIPLAAAFSERARTTAGWSLLAVAAFTVQAVIGGSHPHAGVNSWPRLTLNQDLYLAWTGAAATLLALALRRRTAQIAALAQTRQRLISHAMDSVERERARLANALHDSPVQNLIAASHDLRRAQRTGDPQSFVRLHEALDATIAELRQEIFDLHPHVLDHVGLRAAFEQVARRHAAADDISVLVQIGSDFRFSNQEVLFALGRELLGNAAKHARAHEIRLELSRERDCVRLRVVDDGCGIPQGRIRQALQEGHVGLAASNERVTALGGRLVVRTAPGAGTTVEATLPDAPTEGPAFLRSTARHPRVSDWVTGDDTLWVSTARA
jgi:two-component system NarL family sensor kinase